MTPEQLVTSYLQGERNFSGADLDGGYFPHPCAPGVYAEDGVPLVDIDLSTASLRPSVDPPRVTDLSGIVLNNADLSGADLYACHLCCADLVDATLAGADLTHANLRRADLQDANLSGATLVGANLEEANLCGASLSGADLTDADLEGALRLATDAAIEGWSAVSAAELSKPWVVFASANVRYLVRA